MAAGINIMVWLFLIIMAEKDVYIETIAPENSSLRGSAVKEHIVKPGNQYVEQPNCGISVSGKDLTCHVSFLDGNVDFSNYTVKSITRLTIYCNKKRHLPSKLAGRLFEPIGRTLKHIFIYDCNFIEISRDAFRGLKGLNSLWIKGVSESQICKFGIDTGDVSRSAQQLQTELAIPSSATMNNHENLVLPDGLFSRLDNVHNIKLNAMRLDSSVWHAIKDLKKLEEWDLRQNNISIVDINSTTNLETLQALHLQENSIQRILNGSFEYVSLLRYLDLSSNKIWFIEKGAFIGLSKLYTLILSGNSIGSVERDTFKGLNELYVLDMSRNSISSVETGAFNGLRNLFKLILSGNNIKTIEMYNFRGLEKLHLLLLAHNNIRSIDSEALSRLSMLTTLDISLNFIETLPKFPTTLDLLYLRNNSIVKLTNNSFAGLPDLRTLDLSHNKVIECTRYDIPGNITELNISSNDLLVASLNLTTGLRYGDLRHNQLESITIYGLKEYQYARWPGDIYLAGNGHPFQCVCNLVPLSNVSTFKYERRTIAQYHIWNFTSLSCFSENTHSPGLRNFSAKKFVCNTSCHDNCTCYHWRWGQNNINIVDCLNAGLSSVPLNISASCTILDLSGNSFQLVEPDNFDGLSQLEELYLNASNITEIKEGTFKELSNLTKLDLSNNIIHSVDSGVFKGLIRLSFMNLSFNMINVIVENSFKSLDGLKYLDIVGNELETLTTSDIKSLYKLTSLTLSNNPWSCDCTFLENIIWLTTKVTILDQNNFTCFTLNKTEYNVMRLYMPEFCPKPKKPRHISPAETALYCIVGVAVLGMICFAFLFSNRNFLKLWLFIKFGWKSDSAETEDWNRPYDAFVSYSNADEAFVTTELMPRLEEPRQGRLGYKLCVHFRDFPVGGHIPETILGAVNNSRRVIMILSDNFLSSEWCNYEFQAAHHQLLTEWKNRIIMVLLHDLSSNLLDRQLKLYLSTRTYVKVGDRLLWDKIEYAMPERKQPNEENLNDDNLNDREDNMQAEGDEHTSDDEQLLD